MNEEKMHKIILDDAKKSKDVVYGGRAMNIQLPGGLQRTTWDWDIFTKRPKAKAKKMQAILDREISGDDDFYAKRGRHKGTHRVMHEGRDQRQRTKDDINIVDYTRMPSKIPTVRRFGVRWETLPSIKRGKKKILKDPKSKWRHRKDKDDIERIEPILILRRFL